jgi:hypothetical protein
MFYNVLNIPPVYDTANELVAYKKIPLLFQGGDRLANPGAPGEPIRGGCVCKVLNKISR